LRGRIIAAGRQVEKAIALHPDRSLAQHYSRYVIEPELVAAHAALDVLVDRAFGAKANCETERERQQVLFNRYEELTAPPFAPPRSKARG